MPTVRDVVCALAMHDASPVYQPHAMHRPYQPCAMRRLYISCAQYDVGMSAARDELHQRDKVAYIYGTVKVYILNRCRLRLTRDVLHQSDEV